ncbi:CMRF35-like molecule 9 isoform X4 [Ursus arctos]|uniref:CMRF35-like molecule 9 isoform X4 n=1 Tax=Ursus arctos TaxID=9644 RepID=UPI001CF86C99|nr:CMRF35-like molecule 9 isoform X4 [Ursus arctos]
MWPLVLLWGCLLLPGYAAMVGPKEISGFEGDTVSLQCTYKEELRTRQKYWCRESGLILSRCSGTVYAREDGEETMEGRVSIRDSPQTLTLHVTLRKLTLKDTGKYFCGVSKLGLDDSFLVSLLVFPGPCCPPSPTPSFQPLTTRSLQPRAKAWQTQPPALRTSPHEATSPHAGTSHPSTQLDTTSAKDTQLSPSSSSSVSRVSIPMIRILAPVLVLLALLLAAGLIALGSYLLRWRKEAQLAAKTQRNEKVHLSHLPLEYTVIKLAGPPGPHASPSPCTETQCLSQTSEENEAPSQDPEEDMITGPPLHMSGEELSFSKFISV